LASERGGTALARQQKKRRAQPPPATVPKQLALGWDEAERPQDQGRWAESRDILEELDQRYPNRVEVLASMALATLKQGDSVA